MTLTISIIVIALLVTFIVYRQSLEKKKYHDTTYLSNLQQITSFFDTIQVSSSQFMYQLKVENRELFVVDQGTHSGLNLRVNYEV